MERYIEPFLGGGTIFLEVLSRGGAKSYLLNDVNPHLINLWSCIRDHYTLVEHHLRALHAAYDTLVDWDERRAGYYAFRKEFNLGILDRSRHAALFLALNRTCFNGLTRYNAKGHFNTAFGRRARMPAIYQDLHRLHQALKAADVVFTCGDFDLTVPEWGPGDFAYLDPPYHVLASRKIDDKTYSKEGFGDKDEYRLREMCDRLVEAGARFLLSNHECPEVLACFAGYPVERVSSYKCFTGKASSRTATSEVLLGNALVAV